MAVKTYTWISLWFLLTTPVILWDVGYCFMRPRSMVVDLLYGIPALEEVTGFTNAQSFMNVVETILNVVYLYLAHVSSWPAATLIGFGSASLTLSKTMLYWAQEYFCGYCATGQNDLRTLVVYWIIPNGLWLLFPSLIIYTLGLFDSASSMHTTPFLRNVGRATSLTPSAALLERVKRPGYLQKLAKPEDLVPMFKAIADDIESKNLQANPETKKKFNLFVGASVGPEVEDRWAALDMIARRYPHQVGKEVSKGINAGRIEFADKHLSMFPQDLTYGYYSLHKTHGDPKKPLDWAIVEATSINSDGHIVPGASVGASPEILQSAEKIIIEVNTRIPNLEGLHDINSSFLPPHRQPYLITHPSDRIGSTAIPIDPDRVVAIIESDKPDNTGLNAPENDESRAIAKHLIEFLEKEVKEGRLPKSLLPLQSGIGNVANSIIGGLAEGPFDNVQVWTEVLQDTFLRFFDSGKLDFATATSIRFSPDGFDHFYKNWTNYKDRLLLRSQQVANSPEIIRRLGIIAMNTPLEVDIYGHANSTNALGSRMLNGLGGSADFLRNAKISIMHTPSTRPSKNDPTGISCIVPFASHVDQTEHDLDVIVTEQGLADVRGLSPRERAKVIIDKCAHPDYKDLLHSRGAGHEPHMLRVYQKTIGGQSVLQATSSSSSKLISYLI